MSTHVARAPRRTRKASAIVPLLFLSPFLLSFLLFFLIPSAYSVVLSLFRYRGYGEATFVGFRNYEALLAAPSFWQAVQNTVFYWLVPLVPTLGIAFLLALAVNTQVARLARIYKPILFLPQILAPVAAAVVWTVILSNRGVINTLLGLDIQWLTDPAFTKISVSFLLIWRAIGWYFVIFLAGLTSISEEVLQAAQIDGANGFQRIRYIVLPLMKPIFLFAIVVDTIGSIQLFTEANLLLGTAGGVGNMPPSGAPIMNEVVSNISAGQFGLAAAVGWIIFISIAIFSAIQFRLLGERDKR